MCAMTSCFISIYRLPVVIDIPYYQRRQEAFRMGVGGGWEVGCDAAAGSFHINITFIIFTSEGLYKNVITNSTTNPRISYQFLENIHQSENLRDFF